MQRTFFFLGGTENPPTQRCRTVKRLVSQIQTHWPTSENERQAREAGQHREPAWSPPTAHRSRRAPQTPGTTREAAAHGWNPPRVVNPSLGPTGPPEGRNPIQLGANNMGLPIRDQSMTEHVWTRVDIDQRQTKLVYESLFFIVFCKSCQQMSCSEDKYKIFTLLKYSSGKDIHISFYIGQTEEFEDSWLETCSKQIWSLGWSQSPSLGVKVHPSRLMPSLLTSLSLGIFLPCDVAMSVNTSFSAVLFCCRCHSFCLARRSRRTSTEVSSNFNPEASWN